MKETLILTKILLKNSLNKNINKDGRNFKAMAKNVLLFAAIAYIACVMAFLSKELIDVLRKVNQTEVFISLCLLITIGVSLFRSIISALNILYFSKDIEYLLPLPVSPLKIIFAKFNVMLISGYMLESIIFAIPFIVYGITLQLPDMFYVMSVLVFIFLPIIPTLLGVLFTVVLMNFTNIFKNKDIVQYITVFLTFAIVIAMQVYTMQTSQMTDFMFANKLIEINGISDTIGDYVFILKQAITAVTEYEEVSAIRNIMYLIGESITVYLLVAIIASKTYIKSATNTVSGKNKKIKSDFNKISKRSIRKAYITKEFKTLFRNPIFFLNTVIPIIIIPIVFAIPFLTSDNSMSNETGEALVLAVGENIENTIGFAVCLTIINFLYMFNYISVISISRDGENAIFMKYIPVELHKQCRYKAMPSFVLNLLSLSFVMIGMILLFEGISTVFLLEIIVVALLTNAFVSYGAIIIDVLKPKLHWTTEYSVVKQNINMLWESVFILIVAVIIFGIASFFENVHIVTMLISAILIFTIAFYDNFLKTYSINIFNKIS